MMELRKAAEEGLIDCIASHHIPQDWDNKTCEFEYAKFGMIGLQTCYAAVMTACPSLTCEQILKLFSSNARKIFGLDSATIKEGNVAELTLFNEEQHTFKKEEIKSKSQNSAFINLSLTGSIAGTVLKGNLILNK
jgi:dihydroorotase